MQPILDMHASMIITGDIVLDESTPLLVLYREDKQVDGRIRLTLHMEDGGHGLRIHRTYPQNRSLRVIPLGADIILRQIGRPPAGTIVDLKA